jgi:excisionase family DNA binding protein
MKNITISVEDALTQKEAAQALGITPMTLWRWIRDGKIATIKFGRFKLIPQSEIERLNNASKRPN